MRVNRKHLVANALAASYLLTSPLSFATGREASDASSHHWLPDSTITVAITSKLAAARFSSNTQLKVTTDRGGVVSLSGITGSRREVDRAVAIARGVGGVMRVNNGIVVQTKAK